MNNGIFGFFAGANVTIDMQFFDPAGAYIWHKPKNAKLCVVDGTGGGQGGGGGGAGTNAPNGGAAGSAYEIILEAKYLNEQEIVTIGAGGIGGKGTTGSATVGGEGGETTFAGLVWAGGFGGITPRYPFIGASTTTSNNGFGAGGSAAVNAARSGGHGAGGGGPGTASSGSTGKKYGGRPRYFKFTANSNLAALMTADDGFDGVSNALANGGDTTAGIPGENAFRTVDGYGEGGGGGGRGSTAPGGAPGGNGIRGSGGGGGGCTAGGGANGGSGGDGFLRIVTFCWE